MSTATDNLKRDFCKCVERAARHRRQSEVFADMVRAMSLSIEGATLIHAETLADIEREYAEIRARYTADEFAEFPRALALTVAALEAAREDFLGHALESLGASNTHNGQFLTPVCVSRMMAACLYPKLDGYTTGQIVKLSDPACGTSVLLIEGAERLISQGVRQGDLLVVAGDIDLRACDASYVQLSLLGYPAIVARLFPAPLPDAARHVRARRRHRRGGGAQARFLRQAHANGIVRKLTNQTTKTPKQPTKGTQP